MEIIHCKTKREKRLYLIGGTFCVDLDEIVLITPPNMEKPKGFYIYLKAGAKVHIPNCSEIFAQWLGIVTACTDGDLTFSADLGTAWGMDEAMFNEFQRVSNPTETYPNRERP